jgi:hypothetical protein
MTDRNPATVGKTAKQEPAKGDDGKAVNRDKSSNTAASGNQQTPAKKRRKVNHGTSLKILPSPCLNSFLSCRAMRLWMKTHLLGLGVSILILEFLAVVVIERKS